jgi:hypothetical protein
MVISSAFTIHEEKKDERKKLITALIWVKYKSHINNWNKI